MRERAAGDRPETDAAAPVAGSDSQLLPWEIHPALSEDRLRVCARLLANAPGCGAHGLAGDGRR